MDDKQKANSIVVHVQYATQRTGVPNVAEFRRCVSVALSGRVDGGEVLVRVVDDAESAELNQHYRGKPGPTNVLSFPFEPPAGIPSALLGDLIICAPVVRREAREQQIPARAHWAHMVVHGCLHLLGYDHQNDRDAERMETAEIEALRELGFENPYLAAQHIDDRSIPSQPGRLS